MLAMSVHNIVRSTNASCWPTTCGGKKVSQPFVFKITQQHANNWEVDILLIQCIVFPMLMSPCLSMDEFIIFFQMTKDTMWLLVTHSQLLEGFKNEFKYKITKGGRVRACSLTHNTLRAKGACWSSGMGLRRVDKLHSLTRACTQPTQGD